ncbi:hypothetical protein [Nonomuraea sp. NPDC050540]|uniref:hypothetical protein n=1 Tax=Nonomuraea sp. NPDC050540 TaxID=3364367 RepID=UPI00379C689E
MGWGFVGPQARKDGHQLAAAIELITTFHAIATRHLAATYQQAGGADDGGGGGLDIDLDGAATATATDPDLTQLWDTAQPGARRDLLASLAQLLALTRRRHGLDADDVATMIGKQGGPGRLWMLAERQLDTATAAGRDAATEPMLPDAPHLPALATSPVSVTAEQLVTTPDLDGHQLRLGAAVLLHVATIIDTNATGRWQDLLQTQN